MLINLSNHPYKEEWQPKQIEIAERLFGEIVDLSFPQIEPHLDIAQVKEIAEKYVVDCLRILENSSSTRKNAIHVMGEMTFVYQFVKLMHEKGVLCLASTTTREVQYIEGKQTRDFKFVQFRPFDEI